MRGQMAASDSADKQVTLLEQVLDWLCVMIFQGKHALVVRALQSPDVKKIRWHPRI